YYTGVTSNLELRLIQHKSGFYSDSYTYNRRPVKLVFSEVFRDILQAIKFEKKIKKWSSHKKEALIKGEYGMLPRLSKKKFNR
ncbi:MAG: GIY-YIG nuclease family protein, partial [Flavobacteriaceae bacterium]|nr:GIY-YIG nuclease family protein [Flavobacteriaceae bacterium]